MSPTGAAKKQRSSEQIEEQLGSVLGSRLPGFPGEEQAEEDGYAICTAKGKNEHVRQVVDRA